MTGLQPQLEGKFSSVHSQSQGAQLENILQNCSGASQTSSSQYHTCSSLHRRSQGVQQEIQNKLPLPHRVDHLEPTPKKDIRSMCAVFAAHGRPGSPTESATGNVTRCSAASSMALLTRSYSPHKNKTDVPEGRGNRTAKTNKTTNEFRDKPTSRCEGRKSLWRMCMGCWAGGPWS